LAQFVIELRFPMAPRDNAPIGRSSDLSGKMVFEIHPVLLGGSPDDPRNKAILTRGEHIEAVRHWNGLIKELRGQRMSGGQA
jgi:hypothetical protein